MKAGRGRKLLDGGLLGSGSVSGRTGIAGAAEAGRDAAKIAWHIEQGYSPRAAAELAKSYGGIGLQFVHRSYVNKLIKDYGANSLRGRFLKTCTRRSESDLLGRSETDLPPELRYPFGRRA